MGNSGFIQPEVVFIECKLKCNMFLFRCIYFFLYYSVLSSACASLSGFWMATPARPT